MRMKSFTRDIISSPLLWILAVLFIVSPYCGGSAYAAESVRKERKLIRKGNGLYKEKKYREAARLYNEALTANPESAVGRFNLGMAQMRQGLVADTTRQTQELLSAGLENLSKVAALGSGNPKIASLASYNLGNVAFNKQDYAAAIGHYKQSLRLNPSDDRARRNLRIAQLKQQNQDKDNKDNKDNDNKDNQQNKDKQNQDKNDQNQDRNDDKQNQDRDKDKNQQQQNEKDMSQQTADQILRAVENKENQVRNRVMRGQGSGQGREKGSGRGGRKNW